MNKTSSAASANATTMAGKTNSGHVVLGNVFNIVAAAVCSGLLFF
jgi:hypothetical protein